MRLISNFTYERVVAITLARKGEGRKNGRAFVDTLTYFYYVTIYFNF